MSRKIRLTGGTPGAGGGGGDHTLTVILAGSGGCRVTATGIDSATGDLTQVFPHGTSVVVNVAAAADSDFASWSVAETGNSGISSPFTLTMNGDRTVTITCNLTPGGRIVRKGTQEIEFNEIMDPTDVPAQCIRFRCDVYEPTGARGPTNQNARIKLFLDQGVYCYVFLPTTAATDQAYWNGINDLMSQPDLKPIASGGRLEWYEVGNEPSGAAAHDTYFRRLYGTSDTGPNRGAAQRIRENGGKVMLCHRLNSPTTRDWLDRVRWDLTDGVAYHTYTIDASKVLTNVQGFRNQVDQWGNPPGGGASKPLFLTEYGFHVRASGPSGPVTEAQQANRLEQAFNALWANASALDLRIIGQFAATDYGPPSGNPNGWGYWCGMMATTDVNGVSILPAKRKRPSWDRYKALPESKTL